MAKLPQGTVTLVFTDIEGSTRLLASLGSRYEEVLAIHRRLLREGFSSHGGVEVDTQGDALFYAFPRAQDAVAGAVEAQRALAFHDFGEGVELRVRMGIHTGEPSLSDEGYVGSDVHLGARISAVAWGGQVVVSSATAALVSGDADEISLRSLGEHALKDIEGRVELHQVVAPGLREDFPALRSLSPHPTNLPARLALLIGRKDEIAALVELLSSQDVSVVTVVGPGGTGKTRVALAVGAELLSSFGDGVFFVDLSALPDASLVVPAIAQGLSLREAAGRSLAETLGDYLSSKEMVLILDNFEQVMGAAAEVSSLASSSPSLKVVVTSREALRIEGEREFPLHPLALPSSDSELAKIIASPAVELFVARARAVRPGLAVSDEDARHVAAICRRLDGLPLAIELAAARVKVLSVAALASRLETSLGVLGLGRRDASDRQRTLTGAIAWSYELLDGDEQRFFSRLGVFAGGWSLEATEAMCYRGDLSLDVLDGMASLVDKSLVRAVEADEARFSMLETIREFALEQLEESAEAEEVRRAHAEYFRALAEEAEPHLVGADQKEWLDRLEREHENLRAAMSWSFAGNTDSAIRIAAGARRLWWVRGYLSEGQAWLRRALGAAPDGGSIKVKILRGLTVIVQMQGDNNEAESLARQGLALSKSMTDDEGTISFLITLGLVAEERRDYDGAEAWFQEAIEVARKRGTTSGFPKLINNLGSIALARDQLERAERLFNDSLEQQRQQPDEESRALALMNLGLVALRRRSSLTARPLIIESLACSAALGHSEFIVSNLEILAAIDATEGQQRRAAQLLGLSDALQFSTGFTLPAFERQLRQETLEAVREAMDAVSLSRALEEGGALKLEAVLKYEHC